MYTAIFAIYIFRPDKSRDLFQDFLKMGVS